jgi:hypothetical protein
MRKVWYRKFDGWWYLTLTEAGSRRQIKLLKAPNDKPSRTLAERQAVQELAARQPADGSTAMNRGTASWTTAYFAANQLTPVVNRWYSSRTKARMAQPMWLRWPRAERM